MERAQSSLISSQRPKGVYRTMSWLSIVAGFLLWFPAISLFTVGNKVGIQPVFVIFVLVLTYSIFRRQKISIVVVLLALFWTLALTLSTVFSTNVSQSVRGLLSYLSGLLVFVAAATMIRWYEAPERFILGYTIGGIISSVYTLYQYLAPRLNLPVDLSLLRNTTTFPLYAPTIYTPWRPFGFTAEPSHLAELLIPLAMVLLCQFGLRNKIRYVLLLSLVTVSLFALGSLGTIISLPIAFVAVSFSVPQLARYRTRIFRSIIILTIGLLLVLSIFSVSNSTPGNEQALQSIMQRYSNISKDSSFISRSNSIQIALDIFIKYPFAGVGLFAGLDEFAKINRLPVEIYGKAMGIPNRLLGTLAEQGVIGTLAFLLVVVYAFLNTKSMPLLRTLVITWFVIAVFQGGNALLYNGWVFLGLGCGIKSRYKVTQLKQQKAVHQYANA